MNRRFLDDHKDYRLYDNADFYLHDLPPNLIDGLSGLIPGHCNTGQLIQVINIIRRFIPTAPTTNWGWSFLIQDFIGSIGDLSKSRFDRFMDAILEVAAFLGDHFVDELNQLLDDESFGYRVARDYHDFCWTMVDDDMVITAEAIDESMSELRDISTQTSKHLRQIKENLKVASDRSYKDAVRDAMSAMETLLREITRGKDIDEATQKLREQGSWGPDLIVREGLSIWNLLHKIHPDIRHGNPIETTMPKEEALFWVERMIAFCNYVNRTRRSFC